MTDSHFYPTDYKKSSSPSSSASSPSSNTSNESAVPSWKQINREGSHGSSSSSNRHYTPTSTSSTSSSGPRNWRSVKHNGTDPHNLNKPGLLMTVNPGPKAPHDDPSNSRYEYGPTRLPPVPYHGESPFTTTHSTGRKAGVPLSAVDFLPKLEERVASVERAVDGYMHVRANEALERSSIDALQRHNASSSGPHRPASSGHGHGHGHGTSGSGSAVYPSGQYPSGQYPNQYPTNQYNYQYR